MRCTILALTFALSFLPLSGQDEAQVASANVNSRYVVEGVHYPNKVSSDLRDELNRLVGQHYDQQSVDRLAKRLKKELNAWSVGYRIERGDKPDSVKVFFEPQGRRFQKDANITRLAYHSKYGITGGVEADFDIKELHTGVGVVSDSNELLERFAGWNFNIYRTIADRVRVRFDYEDYHQVWNASTTAADLTNPEVAGKYRERRSFRPTVSVLVARGLVYTAGVDIQHMQIQFPVARTEAATSVIQSLRLRRKWESSDSLHGEIEAGYSLRAATKTIGSDYVYARHFADGAYTLVFDEDNRVRIGAGGGLMTGTAPLFERFAPGNTKTLRGWNKFDLDPLGGSRTVYGSIDYRYGHFLIFYDTGTVWDRDEATVLRHSAGAGFAASGWFLAVAFPIRSNGVQPVFMAGTYF
jgi:hypothetical protein